MLSRKGQQIREWDDGEDVGREDDNRAGLSEMASKGHRHKDQKQIQPRVKDDCLDRFQSLRHKSKAAVVSNRAQSPSHIMEIKGPSMVTSRALREDIKTS